MYIAANMHERSFLAFLFSFAPQIEATTHSSALCFSPSNHILWRGSVSVPTGPLVLFFNRGVLFSCGKWFSKSCHIATATSSKASYCPGWVKSASPKELPSLGSRLLPISSFTSLSVSWEGWLSPSSNLNCFSCPRTFAPAVPS